jgi:2,3-bisphosphoglycerate-dependent phosphoglycerate mutase
VSDIKDEVREIRQFRFERPPGATELLLVRHGETVPARADRPFPLVEGHGDPELTDEGHDQARRAAARLAVEGVDAIYVSNLRRTSQTAAPLVERLGIQPIVERDFREVHLGDWEGGEFRQRVVDQDPIALKMFEEQRWDVIPGAEPAADFAARVRGAVERVAAAHPDQRVAVFTHGGVVGQILADASSSRAFAFTGTDNGAIAHLVVADGRWFIRRFNDTAHLDPRFTLRPAPLT